MIKREEIQKLAELSRITLEGAEEEALCKDIDSILEYVKEVEKAGAHIAEPDVGDTYNAMRDDTDAHEPGMYTEDLLSAAPKRKGEYITVKRILG